MRIQLIAFGLCTSIQVPFGTIPIPPEGNYFTNALDAHWPHLLLYIDIFNSRA